MDGCPNPQSCSIMAIQIPNGWKIVCHQLVDRVTQRLRDTLPPDQLSQLSRLVFNFKTNVAPDTLKAHGELGLWTSLADYILVHWDDNRTLCVLGAELVDFYSTNGLPLSETFETGLEELRGHVRALDKERARFVKLTNKLAAHLEAHLQKANDPLAPRVCGLVRTFVNTYADDLINDTLGATRVAWVSMLEFLQRHIQVNLRHVWLEFCAAHDLPLPDQLNLDG